MRVKCLAQWNNGTLWWSSKLRLSVYESDALPSATHGLLYCHTKPPRSDPMRDFAVFALVSKSHTLIVCSSEQQSATTTVRANFQPQISPNTTVVNRVNLAIYECVTSRLTPLLLLLSFFNISLLSKLFLTTKQTQIDPCVLWDLVWPHIFSRVFFTWAGVILITQYGVDVRMTSRRYEYKHGLTYC